jgi:hypothetical protein
LTTDIRDTFAVVLMKCRPGDESTIRTIVATQRTAEEAHVCLRGADAPPHKNACQQVTVRDAAYCFGPFDFLFVVQSAHVHHIERFVVECIRGDASLIQDTQTILGITI